MFSCHVIFPISVYICLKWPLVAVDLIPVSVANARFGRPELLLPDEGEREGGLVARVRELPLASADLRQLVRCDKIRILPTSPRMWRIQVGESITDPFVAPSC